LADIDFNSLLPAESEETITERMLADLPAPPGGNSYNTREGSVIHGLFRPLVFERARLISYASELFQQSFVAYATGDYLDIRAGELGVSRGGALNSTVNVTVTGTSGVVLNANNSTFASAGDSATGVESVSFVPSEEATIPAGGSISVPCVSTTAGLVSNVDAGEITLIVDAPDGISSVTNPTAASGGADEEDDESLRLSLSQRLQSLAGTANAAYYNAVALREPDVQNVAVTDLWDGNGTALVTLSGRLAPYVGPDTVERLQEFFDPSVKNLAHFEAPESWTNGTTVSAALEGKESIQIDAHHPDETTISHTFSNIVDLSEFDSAADEVSLFIKRVTSAGDLQDFIVKFISSNSGTATATISAATINSLSNITTRAVLNIPRSDFTEASDFSWASVQSVEITLEHPATSSTTNTVVVDGLRIKSTTGGFLTGQVPIGIQVTVRSARSASVDVTGEILLDAGLVVADIEGIIESSISDYFRRLPSGSVIRIAEIANIIHDTRGVVDYENLQLNSLSVNTNLTTLESDQGPVLGTLTLTAI